MNSFFIFFFSFLIFNIFSLQNAFSRYTCNPENVAANSCSHLVKLNSDAALGSCLSDTPTTDIKNLLARNNIRAYTGKNPRSRFPATNLEAFNDLSDSKMLALTRVVEAFDKIGDGRFRALKNGEPIDVVFANSQSTARNSRRFGNQIQITGGSQNMIGTQQTSDCNGMDNHGLIAHELGHYVAGNNNQKVHNDYVDYMKGNRCRLTSYTTKNLSEEIAEVIAAYITMPQAFKDKGESCNQAFSFMKNLFGEPNLPMTCLARKNSIERNPIRMANDYLPPKRPTNRSGNVVF